jgi:nitronate monooxygenase
MMNFALLGTELPIIQAPMAGAQLSGLALAVGAAGGLGSLPAAMLSPQALQAEMGKLFAGSRRHVNINFFCHAAPVIDHEREGRWVQALQRYYAEFGLTAPQIGAPPARQPFSEAHADVIEPYAPSIVSFHFGLPGVGLMRRIRSWDAKIFSSATTVAEARWLEAHGVDAIIAQGLEAGGHRGHFLSTDISLQSGTFALLPQIVAAVKVPVIAAGGIADAHGVRAAMALGASAVQVGTAFLLCPEAETSAVHRAALRSAAASYTDLTNIFTGRPARGILNRAMRELGPMSPLAPAFPLATNAIAPLRQHAEAKGSGEFSPLWAGQNVRGCREIPAGELTRELVRLL